MNKLTQTEAVEGIEVQRRLWLARNPGLLAQIARDLGVSTPFMSDIFKLRRNSRDGRIEARLIEAGAPGFDSGAGGTAPRKTSNA